MIKDVDFLSSSFISALYKLDPSSSLYWPFLLVDSFEIGMEWLSDLLFVYVHDEYSYSIRSRYTVDSELRKQNILAEKMNNLLM